MPPIDTTLFKAAAEAEEHQHAAYFYADQGFGVIPLVPGSKRPPSGTSGYRSATRDYSQIAEWWEANPDYGIGIVPDTAMTIVVDIDGPEGLADWKELGYDVGDDTVTIRTPGKDGGYHRYYTATQAQLDKLGGPKYIGSNNRVEVIGSGRYVLVPPTPHPDGGHYVPLHTSNLAPFPDSLIELASPSVVETVKINHGVAQPNPNCRYCPSAATYKIKDIGHAREGSRNHTLYEKLNQILELPCISDDYQPFLDRALSAYLRSGGARPTSKKEFDSTLYSVMNHQRNTKGGFGTGACDNALRVHSVATVQGAPTVKRLVAASEIEAKHRQMLFRNLIPLNALTVLAGAPGKGKSTFLRWLAAQVTHGTPLVHGIEGSVLWVSAEEAQEVVLRPALEAASADLDRVFLEKLGSEGDNFKIDDDGVMLREYVKQINGMKGVPPVKLVVIDSLELYLPDTDNNNSKGIKAALKGPAEQSDQLDLSVVVVEHLNKSFQAGYLNRVLGSAAKLAMARALLGWGNHPTDWGRLRLSLLKGNYASPFDERSEIFEFGTAQVTVKDRTGQRVKQDQGYLKHIGSEKLPPSSIFDDQDQEGGPT